MFQKNVFSLKITSATNRGNHTLHRCGVGKDSQSRLVDHNYQVEQGEIQRQCKNTT